MMLIEHSGNVRCFATRWQFKAVWATMILFGVVSIARVHGQEILTLQGTFPTLRFNDIAGTPQEWGIVGDDLGFDIINVTADSAMPFHVDPLAYHNSLVVGAYGLVGFGTFSPNADLHVSTNALFPSLRLETTGVVPRAWDLQGSGSGFNITDVTNANAIPFGIQAGAPTNSFLVDTTGMIGLGTSTPAARLHARVPAVAGVESIVKFDITDDAIGKLEINNASASNGVFHPRFRGTTNAQAVGLTFEGAITDDIGANPVVSFAASKIVGGSVTNRPLLVVRNNQTVRVRVAANGDMFATSFSPTSSRALKENIVDLDSQKASKALQQLTPSNTSTKTIPLPKAASASSPRMCRNLLPTPIENRFRSWTSSPWSLASSKTSSRRLTNRRR